MTITPEDMADTEPGMPELIDDAPSPCFVCKQPPVFKCGSCGDVRYCSAWCQKQDWKVHKSLCVAFSLLEPCPETTYYRGIIFPVDSTKPKFVWVEFVKNDYRSVNTRHNLALRLPHVVELRRCHKLGRLLEHSIAIEKSRLCLTNRLPDNRCPTTLLGVTFHKFNCSEPFLVHRIKKQSQIDLNTSALSPVLGDFKYNARNKAAHHRKLVKALAEVANSGN
jgi:hypothetical protein